MKTRISFYLEALLFIFGIILGISLSSIIGSDIFNSPNNVNNTLDQQTWNNSTAVSWNENDWSNASLSLEQNIPKLLLSDIESIYSQDDMKRYQNSSLLPMAVLYYAIVHKKEALWNMYWTQMYADTPWMASIPEEEFKKTTQNIYQDILEQKVEIGEYPLLLDGSIIWANVPIENKVEACKTYEYGVSDDETLVQSCIGKSYMFESYINGNNSCEKIEWAELRSFCEQLIEFK